MLNRLYIAILFLDFVSCKTSNSNSSSITSLSDRRWYHLGITSYTIFARSYDIGDSYVMDMGYTLHNPNDPSISFGNTNRWGAFASGHQIGTTYSAPIELAPGTLINDGDPFVNSKAVISINSQVRTDGILSCLFWNRYGNFSGLIDLSGVDEAHPKEFDLISDGDLGGSQMKVAIRAKPQ